MRPIIKWVNYDHGTPVETVMKCIRQVTTVNGDMSKIPTQLRSVLFLKDAYHEYFEYPSDELQGLIAASCKKVECNNK